MCSVLLIKASPYTRFVISIILRIIHMGIMLKKQGLTKCFILIICSFRKTFRLQYLTEIIRYSLLADIKVIGPGHLNVERKLTNKEIMNIKKLLCICPKVWNKLWFLLIVILAIKRKFIFVLFFWISTN